MRTSNARSLLAVVVLLALLAPGLGACAARIDGFGKLDPVLGAIAGGSVTGLPFVPFRT